MSAKHMRREFAQALYAEMAKDSRIWVLTADLGNGVLDQIRQDYPQRYLNCGAAEQTMLDIAVGLAYSGRIPFCYSITSFLLYRGFETLRTYIAHENLAVKLCGAGRDTDYRIDGYSHHSSDARAILALLPAVKTHWPSSQTTLTKTLQKMLTHNGPDFISLRKAH